MKKVEIKNGLTIIKDTSKTTSEKVLSWVKRIEMQHSRKAMLESLKDKKEPHMIRNSK